MLRKKMGNITPSDAEATFLIPRHKNAKKIWKQIKHCQVGINWKALTEF